MNGELHLIVARQLKELSGIKISLTFEFFDVIDAADNLIGLKQILKNLLSIIPLLEMIDSQQWDYDKRNNLLLVCNALLKNEISIRQLILENNVKNEDLFNKNSGNTPNALHGPVVSNPLYSSLWSTRSLNRLSFLHLQAQFIQSFHQYKKLQSNNKEFDSARKTFSFLIRGMHNDVNKTNLLSFFPTSPTGTDELFNNLTYQNIQDLDLKEQLNELIRVLAYALGNRTISSRNSKVEQVETKKTVLTKQFEDPDTELDLESLQYIKTSNMKPSEIATSFYLGNSVEEAFCGPVFIKSDKPIRTDKGETPEDRTRIHKEKIRGIATYNQHLPYQWSRLNYADFISLMKGIEELANQGNQIELATILSIMFWTSSSFERATKIQVIKQAPNTKKNELYFCIDDCSWSIQSPIIKQRNMGKDWRLFIEPISPNITLPCISNTASLIKKIIKSKKIPIRKTGQFLFSENLEKEVQDYISKLNKENNSRLTKIRISTYLYHLLADQTGDVGDAAYITGNLPAAGQSTALYYYAPKEKVLTDKYVKVCNKLIQSINPQLTSPLKKINLKENRNNLTNNKRVGSRICPLKITVKLMVKDLKKMHKYRTENRTNQNFLIALHNAYTAYTVMLFGFSTGYRAVNDPFYSVMDIDWDSQFVSISDKDSDDYYNTRIVWLPDITLKQLKFYEEHRDQLIEEMTLLNPFLAEKLKTKITINWKSEIKRKDTVPFFFFLNEKCKVNRVGPISLKENVKWSYELPQNTNRHFLRTKLREQNVIGEIVDIFMGHWELGQEPHNHFSTLSPQEYKSNIAGPLTKILKAAGWIHIRGLG